MDQDRAPAKLLVVDDERGMRELLELLLLKEGYDVQCAESGAEALELFRSTLSIWS